MDARSAYDARDEAVILDVREPFEWDAGHIDGSLHVPFQELGDRVGELPSGTRVITTCTVGMRASVAADMLRAKGIDADSMDGGLVAWSEAGFPVVRDDGTPGEVWRA